MFFKRKMKAKLTLKCDKMEPLFLSRSEGASSSSRKRRGRFHLALATKWKQIVIFRSKLSNLQECKFEVCNYRRY